MPQEKGMVTARATHESGLAGFFGKGDPFLRVVVMEAYVYILACRLHMPLVTLHVWKWQGYYRGCM